MSEISVRVICGSMVRDGFFFTLVSPAGICFQLVTSGVSCHGHVIVQLQFFETVVRYDKFFQTEPEHIPDCLVSEARCSTTPRLCCKHTAVTLRTHPCDVTKRSQPFLMLW